MLINTIEHPSNEGLGVSNPAEHRMPLTDAEAIERSAALASQHRSRRCRTRWQQREPAPAPRSTSYRYVRSSSTTVSPTASALAAESLSRPSLREWPS